MIKEAKDWSVTLHHKTMSCICETFTIQKNVTQDASGDLFLVEMRKQPYHQTGLSRHLWNTAYKPKSSFSTHTVFNTYFEWMHRYDNHKELL